MTVWALVPVKNFSSAKSRLADVLTAAQRATLAHAMLLDTLAVLKPVSGLAGIALVTSEPAAVEAGLEIGTLVFNDPDSDLNSALSFGHQCLMAHNPEATVLVLPSDLPLLRGKHIDRVLERGRGRTSVVIVPAHDKNGTNTLLTGPDIPAAFSFGPGSFQRHMDQARAADQNPVALDIPEIGQDLDTPSDLERLREKAVGPRTAALFAVLQTAREKPVGAAP